MRKRRRSTTKFIYEWFQLSRARGTEYEKGSGPAQRQPTPLSGILHYKMNQTVVAHEKKTNADYFGMHA